MLVHRLSTDQLRALWENGVALDSAWIEFARFFDRFAHRALNTYPANDPDVLAPHPRYKELIRGWLPRTWEARQEKLVVTTRNERLHLLQETFAGRLWAIGFRTRPSGLDEPVRIPRQHFFVEETSGATGADIHWGRGELRVGGTTYFDIRVVRAPTKAGRRSTVLPRRKRKKAGGRPKRTKTGGRPNTSRRIRREVRRLWVARPGFQNLPVKRMVIEVRGEILGEARRNEEAVGYRSSSMAKRIGHELHALRKRNKPNKPNKR